MTAQELLDELARLDIRLTPAGKKLWLDAPKRVLTEELLSLIRQHKTELLRLLTETAQCDSLDHRRDPATGQWVREPGWWRSMPQQPSPPPNLAQPAPLPPAEGREPSRPVTLALSLRRDGTCYLCSGSKWWVSVYGVLTCVRCHPPPVPELVARYVCGEEAARLAKTGT